MKVKHCLPVFIILTVVLMVTASVVVVFGATEGPLLSGWTDVQKPLPTPRNEVAYCVAGYKLWVIGGVDSSGSVRNTIEAYYPFSNLWERDTASGGLHPPLPVPRANACAAAIGANIYIFGGRAADGAVSGDVFVYNTTTKTWSTRSSMPLPRQGASAVVYAGKIHIIGGFTSSGSSGYDVYEPSLDKWSPASCTQPLSAGNGTATIAFDRSVSPTDDLVYYVGGASLTDPALDTVQRRGLQSGGCWTSTAPLAYGLTGHAACALTAVNPAGGSMDYVMAIGGYTQETGYTDSISAYVPDPYNGWIADSRLPSPRGGRFAVGVIGTNVYIAGGCNASGMLTQTLKAAINGGNYPPAPRVSDSIISEWQDMASDIPTPRIEAASAVYNGRIYIIGGTNAAEDSIYDAVEEYNPSTNNWRILSPLPVPVMKASAAVLDGKIYVAGGVDGWGIDPETWEYYETVTNVLQIYNPSSGSWTVATGMNSARKNASAVSYNGRLYVMGGEGSIGTVDPVPTTVESYDPVLDAWEPATFACPWPADEACAFMHTQQAGQSIFFVGGNSNSVSVPFASCYLVDSGSWDAVANMPVNGIIEASGVSVTTPDGRTYPMIFGGINPPVGYYNRCYSYRPADGQSPAGWKPDTSMPYAIGGSPAVGQIGGFVYLMGGASDTFDGCNPHVIRGTISSGTVIEAGTIAEIKPKQDGKLIRLNQPKTVTSVVVDGNTGSQICFYIEEDDRSSGIRVTGTTQPLVSGNIVYVEGVLGTSESGERQINPTSVNLSIPSSGPLPKPFGFWNRSFAGGLPGRIGMNAAGLLVKTWGKITRTPVVEPSGHCYFYIDDGSRLVDGTATSGSSNKGLRVWFPGPLTLPGGAGLGDYVVIEGISSFHQVLGTRIPQLILDDPQDIQVMSGD